MSSMDTVKKRIIISMGALVLLILTLVGITYAYFLSNVKGNAEDKSISVVAGMLRITYGDGNRTIKAEKIKPGTVISEKTFTVKNTGKNPVEKYDVYLENVVNELKYYEDLVYTLTCESSDGKECYGSSGIFPKGQEVIATNDIDVDEIHTYKIILDYKETNMDQSDDMNKIIDAKINIKDDLNNIKEFKILGNSIQPKKPNSLTPVEINTLGILITDVSDPGYGKYLIPIRKEGKNLFNINELYIDNIGAGVKNLMISENTFSFEKAISPHSSGVSFKIYLEKGVYTISGEGTSSNNSSLGIVVLKDGNIYINKASKDLNHTLNIGEDGEYIIAFYPDYSEPVGTVTTIKNVQLEKGSEKTSYEPYGIVLDNIYLDEPLRKVGDCDTCYDYIDIENRKVVRNVKYMEFKGTDNWSIYESVANHFQISVRDNYFSEDENYVMSNYYSADKRDGSYYSNSDYAVMSVDGNRIRFKNKDYNTLDEWRDYLEGLPANLSVLYKLKEPIETIINVSNYEIEIDDKISVCDLDGVCASDIIIEYDN